MNVACPHCRGRMDVPDMYLDRLVKCVRCQQQFVPEHDGRRGEVTTAYTTEKLPPEPDPSEFRGIDTDSDRLVAMCLHAKARGNSERYHFLAAYSNAVTALKRDTWQAASFEWQNAQQLLAKVRKERAQPLVDRTRQEFVNLAADQLMDFVEQMRREYEAEIAHLPERVRRVRATKIAKAFRALVVGPYATLVTSEVVRRVERVADEWAAGAVA